MKQRIDRFRVILFIISLLVLIPFFFSSISRLRPESGPTLPVPTFSVDSSLILDLDFGTGSKSSFTSAYAASESAFTLLQTVTARENLEFSFKQYPFGNLVESIAGYANSREKAWIYFVNGRSPDIGASDYRLQPGDRVEWKYTQPL